jgi:membrane protein
MSKKSFARLIRIVTGTFGSAKEDGFSLDTSLTKLEKFVHFWVLVWNSFVRNRCPVRASALSYTTLLALIPMLAVAMSVTSMFLKSEGKEKIEQFIQSFVDKMVPAGSAPLLHPALPDHVEPAESLDLSPVTFDATNFLAALAATNGPLPAPDVGVVNAKANVSKQAADYIHKFVENTYSTTLGVTGMAFLLLTAILTLTRVEETFNDIWGVTRGRDWWSRIANYFTTITLGPMLIIAALGLANGPNFEKTRSLLTGLPWLAPLVSSVLPVAVICLTFALFYKLVPNTRVDFGAALIGGSLAGVAWHIYNHLGFLFASRVVSANAIYGGLAMIPLLMGGLYIVWLTVLFGAQVAYAFQNRAAYLQDQLAENVNQRGREFVALRLMTCIGQRFNRGLPPATIREISAELGVPSKLAQQVLRTLLAAHLVVEVSGAEAGYNPARPLDAINCHHILLAMRAASGQEFVTREEPVRAEVLGEFARIQAAEEAVAASVSMLALVNRAHARLALAAQSEPVIPASATPATTLLAAAPAVAPVETIAPVEPSAKPADVELTPEVVFSRPDAEAGNAPKPDSEHAATPASASDAGESSPNPGSRCEPQNRGVGQAFQPAGDPDFPVRGSERATGKSPTPADKNVRPTGEVHGEASAVPEANAPGTSGVRPSPGAATRTARQDTAAPADGRTPEPRPATLPKISPDRPIPSTATDDNESFPL